MNEEIRKALFSEMTTTRLMIGTVLSPYSLTDDHADLIVKRLDKMESKIENELLAAEATHKAEISGLVEALSYYAKDRRYHGGAEAYVMQDRGRIATQALAPYKKVPCKECGGSGRLRKVKIVDGVINYIEDVNCPHCTNGHVWERREGK